MTPPSELGVLITGAGGTIGLNLVSALAGACRLRCLVRRAQPFRDALEAAVTDAKVRDEIEVAESDLCDRDAVQRACRDMAVVVHLAARTSDEDPSQFALLEVNVLGCLTVLQEAERVGVRRVIFPSTYHVYGRLRVLPAGPVSEETPLNPASVYAASKAVGESMVRSAGVDGVIVRLSHVYGAGVGRGDWGGVLLRFIDQALQDSAIPLDAGAGDVRDYLHITDAVACLRRLALARASIRGTFNVGSGQSVTLLEMAQWIAEGIERFRGGPVEICLPEGVMGPSHRAVLDLNRIRQACGFVPQKAPKEGIDELLGHLVPSP